MAKAKRERLKSNAQAEDKLNKKRGIIDCGDPNEYLPFVLVHDVGSLGRSSRTKLGERVAHTLSDLETMCLNELRWNPQVTDIFEQVALDRTKTVAIAEKMKFKHPELAKDRKPYVMSTDFVVDVSVNGFIRRHAIAVKPVSAIDLSRYNLGKLTDKRKRTTIENTIAKLEIERRYWVAEDVKWSLVTDAVLSKDRNFNIVVFLSVPKLPVRSDHTNYWGNVSYHILRGIKAYPNRQINTIAAQLEKDFQIPYADVIDMLRYLCGKRAIEFNMDVRFGPECHGRDFLIPSRSPDLDSWKVAA